MMGRMENKNVLLTGASGGIGKEVAWRLAEEGASLAICARNEERLMQTAQTCQEKGARVLARTCDITQEGQIRDFVHAAGDFFDGRLDVLINNAVTIRPPYPFLEQDTAALDESLQSGLYSTWHFMQMCFPLMKENGGSIINFGSGSGFLGNAGYAAYACTKEAVRALTRVAAREWGEYGIRANTISPGVVTDHIKDSMEHDENLKEYLVKTFTDNPMRRMGDPSRDIAPVVIFLSTEDSSYMTGQDFRVEGGAIMTA